MPDLAGAAGCLLCGGTVWALVLVELKILEGVCDGAEVFRQEMGVGFHCLLNGGVTEVLAYADDSDALVHTGYQIRGAAVAEVVNADALNTGSSGGVVHSSCDIGGAERIRAAEYKGGIGIIF